MSDCPYCGSEIIKTDSSYCSECGEKINICSSCGSVTTDDSSFCSSCGEPRSADPTPEKSSVKESPDESTTKDYTSVGEPNSGHSTLKALTYGLIPGLGGSIYEKSLIGGCPSCGEGRDLTVESNTGILDYNPLKSSTDNDYECNRCGCEIESDGRWMYIIKGDSLIEGKKISEAQSTRFAKYRRQERESDYKQLAENLTDKEVADKNTDKAFGIASRLYYYPIALIIFLYGIGIAAVAGRISDLAFATILAGLALPDIRKWVGQTVGFSLPWWGNAILAVFYGFVGLAMLFGLFLLPTM